ncbi:MAG: metallopeptidase family protein [Candidatus Humimicrobiaceae bacterium]
MENMEFEELILKFVSEIPQKFKDGLKNIDIIVDYDNYSHKENHNNNKSDITLGLYQGLPNTQRPGHYRNIPDLITIYKKSLDSVSKNDSELASNLKRVLLHEIGHYFGMDEEKLRELGY